MIRHSPRDRKVCAGSNTQMDKRSSIAIVFGLNEIYIWITTRGHVPWNNFVTRLSEKIFFKFWVWFASNELFVHSYERRAKNHAEDNRKQLIKGTSQNTINATVNKTRYRSKRRVLIYMNEVVTWNVETCETCISGYVAGLEKKQGSKVLIYHFIRHIVLCSFALMFSTHLKTYNYVTVTACVWSQRVCRIHGKNRTCKRINLFHGFTDINQWTYEILILFYL